MTALDKFELAGRRVGEERYEIIFVDPAVPNFSRQDFAHLVRHFPINSHAPVALIVTANAEEAEKGELPPGCSLMARPSSAADLLPRLEELRQKLLADRRKDCRFDYRTSVLCIQISRHLKAISVNLSTTGILLETNWVWQRDDELELHFQIADRGPDYIARLIRLKSHERAALGFQNLSPATCERLRKFIETHLPDLRAADRKHDRPQRACPPTPLKFPR